MTKRVALVAVILTVAAVIGYKQLRPVPSQSVVHGGSGPQVVLVADLSEAEEKCACGEIIRAVRAAQKKGIATQELTPDSKSEVLRQYRVLTAPTVLFLDADGKDIARYEGADENTVADIKAHLDRLIPGSGR